MDPLTRRRAAAAAVLALAFGGAAFAVTGPVAEAAPAQETPTTIDLPPETRPEEPPVTTTITLPPETRPEEPAASTTFVLPPDPAPAAAEAVPGTPSLTG